MKIIVGLGNPGEKYAATRHNIGFMVADYLAEHWQTAAWRSFEAALVTESRSGAEKILLVKPQTYMNDSGIAVGAVARFYKVASEDILVICDDMDMPVGKLRLRPKGSSGGHHGLDSIMEHLGEGNFIRLKIGISHPLRRSVIDHVLTPFTAEEAPLIEAAITQATEAIELWLAKGIQPAMNEYNKKR